MMMTSVLATMLAASSAQAVDCPVGAAELDLHLVRALAAFEEHRFLDFERERHQAERAMDCVGEVVRDQALVNLHLVWTTRALLDGDEAGLLAGMRALRVVAPGFTLPGSWSEAGSRVDELFHEATTEGPGRELRLPGRMVVDGHPAAQFIPAERSAVVQIRNKAGHWSTWYVEPAPPEQTWSAAQAVRAPGPAESVAPVPVPVTGD